MDETIWLDVPPAMEAFAKLHGATHTKAEGWSVPEAIFNVTPELWDFRRVEEARTPKPNLRPSCPLCKGFMVAIPNPQIGKDHWKCFIKSCNGTSPIGHVRVYLNALTLGRQLPDCLNKIDPDDYLMALKLIFKGSGLHIDKWFYSPKVVLRGETPEKVLWMANEPSQITRLFIEFARDWLSNPKK